MGIVNINRENLNMDEMWMWKEFENNSIQECNMSVKWRGAVLKSSWNQQKVEKPET